MHRGMLEDFPVDEHADEYMDQQIDRYMDRKTDRWMDRTIVIVAIETIMYFWSGAVDVVYSLLCGTQKNGSWNVLKVNRVCIRSSLSVITCPGAKALRATCRSFPLIRPQCRSKSFTVSALGRKASVLIIIPGVKACPIHSAWRQTANRKPHIHMKTWQDVLQSRWKDDSWQSTCSRWRIDLREKKKTRHWWT